MIVLVFLQQFRLSCLSLHRTLDRGIDSGIGPNINWRHRPDWMMARQNESEMLQELAVGIGMELKKLRKVRGAHRAYVTRTMPAARGSIETFQRGGNRKDLLKYKGILSDKKDMLRSLDERILDIMSEECESDECIEEVDESEAILMEISEILAEIEEKLESHATTRHQSPMENGSFSGSSSTKKAKAKLPKLDLQTFNGKPQDWPEFWDAFSSIIDQDEDLPDAVKFQYLKKSLLEPAKSVISGFKITAANYRAAVDLLRERYAKPTLIKRAHINEMLNIKDIWDERQVEKMRAFHDTVETHYRGLEALNVEEETYASIVVPVLLEKIPQSVRWNMVRGSETDHLEWNVRDFLENLKKELQVREMQVPIFGPGNTERRQQTPRRFVEKVTDGTATALHTFRADGFRKRCAFCQEEHEEEHCEKVKNVNARKSIIRKYGRCFICIRKGHKAVECRSKSFCKICNGRHHVSLCERYKDSQSSKGPYPTNPTAPPSVGSILGSANVTSCTHNSLGPTSSAALQTAQAVVNGKEENKVRVLFDSGSQKTFVTAEVVEKAKLRVVRKEMLGIKAFGSVDSDRKLRDVVELDLRATGGGRRMKIEAYVVGKISDVGNCHVEHVKMFYPHLTNIEFSDISDEDNLKVDVLVGADFLWDFQGQETIRGEKNEPVAVKTELGWVLSGPLKGESLINPLSNVNVACVEITLDKKVEQFRNLDTVGSRGIAAEKLKNNRVWWEGPEWLPKGEAFWHKDTCIEGTEEVDVEEKKDLVVLMGAEVEKCLVGSVIDVDTFSDKGRLLVKQVLSKCTICKRSEGRPYTEPKTAALPSFRVQPAEPFSNTGVDFAGPLYVKENEKKQGGEKSVEQEKTKGTERPRGAAVRDTGWRTRIILDSNESRGGGVIGPVSLCATSQEIARSSTSVRSAGHRNMKLALRHRQVHEY